MAKTIEGQYRVVSRRRAPVRRNAMGGLGDFTYQMNPDRVGQGADPTSISDAGRQQVQDAIGNDAILNAPGAAIDAVSSGVSDFLSTLGTVGRYVLIGGVIVLLLWASKDHYPTPQLEYETD